MSGSRKPSRRSKIGRKHHGLHRPDRGRRHGQAAEADGRSAPWPRAACRPFRRKGSAAYDAARALSTMRFKARSTGAESGSKRVATRLLSRSAAKRYCTRSLVPTERKSTRAAELVELPEQGRHLDHDAELEIGRQRLVVLLADRRLRARQALSRVSNSSSVATIGNMMRSSRPARGAQQGAQLRCARGPAGRGRCGSRASRAPDFLPRPWPCKAGPCRSRCRACGR